MVLRLSKSPNPTLKSVNSEIEIEVSPNLKSKVGNCGSNQENDTFPMKISSIRHVNDHNVDDIEVDVVTKTNSKESVDATECSSSFGCTDSGKDVDEVSSEAEVESRPWDDNIAFTGFDLLRPRKRKLSSQWRDYVRPVMWRCQWVELQIRKLQSQASKYVRELDECDKIKRCELEKFSAEEYAMNSDPYVGQNRQEKLMKRVRRRRVEDTVDLASYTASHNLFSYFANKGSGADAAYGNDDHRCTGKTHYGNGEFGVGGDVPFVEFQDNDEFGSILRKIEEAQEHVRMLRMRMDKVFSENAETFISDSSNCLHDQLIRCGPNSVLSHVNDKPALLGSLSTTFQQSSKKLRMPESSIAEQVIPDMTKIVDDLHIRGMCEKIENKTLICNQPVKEDANDAKDVQTQLLAQSLSQPEVKTGIVQRVLTMPQEQLTMKTRQSSKVTPPKNTSKCGRRKARAARWSKRVSG